MLSNFERLPRDLMVKEHARVTEKLDLACRLLNSQGKIIEQQREELSHSKQELEELSAIYIELKKTGC